MKIATTTILLAATLVSCCPARPVTTAAAVDPDRTGQTNDAALVKNVSLAQVGLDAGALDPSTEPCDDFYKFACGGWLEKTSIPADKSRWMRGISEVHARNEADLRRILDDATTNPQNDPVKQQIGAYYGACMDEAAVEKRGYEDIKPLLQLVADNAADAGQKGKPFSAANIETKIARLHRVGVWALFDIASGQDSKDATKMIAQIDQNGLGMPDRDYYLKDDDKAQQLRKTYRAHVGRMFELIGFSKQRAEKAANTVITIETDIAKISKTKVARRDPKGMYNRVDRPGLRQRSQKFNWDAYFKYMGLEATKEVSVTSIPFIEGLNGVLERHSSAAMSEYLMWQVVSHTASWLPKAFVDEEFRLRKALTGQLQPRPRWKRCIAAVDHNLGELLAQAFVAQRFSGDSKRVTQQMVKEISAAFGRDLKNLAWMDNTTRNLALNKLKKLAYLIGYPDVWKSYDFKITADRYTANALRARSFTIVRELNKIGHPVDRNEWMMTPPTVNAYYSPSLNQMVFPAGILQPPFYNPKANIPVNMGAMGMVVGHELTHGFDDQGAQFDADGNLKNWWQPNVEKQFKTRTSCVKNQYDHYQVLPGLMTNGELTLGENIADAGGVKLAFEAYRAMRHGAREVLVADGYSEDQQFFLSIGQVWCAKYRDEAARMRAKTDPHAHPRWRVNGALQNTAAFAQAFSCAPGTPMPPATACNVW